MGAKCSQTPSTNIGYTCGRIPTAQEKQGKCGKKIPAKSILYVPSSNHWRGRRRKKKGRGEIIGGVVGGGRGGGTLSDRGPKEDIP